MTPHIGFMKPNTATFDTGLYFKSIAHNEYAAADTNARYRSIMTEPAFTLPIFPPQITPISVITNPPKKNCQPLSITGFSDAEYRFINTEENPFATVDINTNPSPIRLKLTPPLSPLRLMIMIPLNPSIQPIILCNVSFSILYISDEISIAIKTFAATMTAAFTPVVWASPM